MSLKLLALAPLLAAAGISVGVATAPAAVAQDPCKAGVSTSRCLGPQGIASVPKVSPGSGVQNGPYGPWGMTPPLG